MKILGIAAFYHDSSAALIIDGDIVAAAHEERFTRKKGDASFPEHAIRFCLQFASLSVEDLDSIVFYDKPITKFDRILASYIHRAPIGLWSFLKAIPIWLREKLWTEDTIRASLKFKGPIYFTDHHQSHASSAYFPSPYQDAAIITIDGAGEWTTTTIGHGSGSKIQLLRSIQFPHSLGLLYSAFTYYCGFKVNSGEYKLMGLAPYGSPKYLDLIRSSLVVTADDGSFILNEKYFNYVSGLKMISKKFAKLFGQAPLRAGSPITQFHMDVAASIQEFMNQHLVLIAQEARRLTGSANLVLAGGVGLNCVSNSRIRKESGFSNVWVQPAAGDAGCSIGAALYASHEFYDEPRVVGGTGKKFSCFLGPSYDNNVVKSQLDSVSAVYTHYSYADLLVYAAKAIDSQKVIGWFQGRMEFGPRALGARSILGDARSPDMQKLMNLKIKFRESFRPFAPSILQDRCGEFFEDALDSPYMMFTSSVKKDHLLSYQTQGKSGFELLSLERSRFPGITHIDNSARLQTVSEADNKLYFDLLSAFNSLTGCPMIINTSFNVRGEPIVCSPIDAYRCFVGTNIDILIIGNYVLEKESQPKMELEEWKKSLIQD